MNDIATRVAHNVNRVRERIARAAEAVGRTAEDVLLVAVTKYGNVAEVEAVVAAACRTLGESRPQALWEKVPQIAAAQITAAQITAPEVEWHLIGHLQRNKVRRTLPLVSLIHSVDSLRLLQAIDEAAADRGQPARVLLEVNISGDPEKHGWSVDALRHAVEGLADYRRVEVRGLMTMASRTGDEQVARANFASLRALRDELAADCPANVELVELSMGMSRDFEAAIHEGATIVRIGSALFEDLSGAV